MRHRKKASQRGVLTLCREQTEGQVRTPKERRRARDTHALSRADGGTSENAERKAASEGHSRTVEGRRRDK
jgi:hypothetical protein